MNIANCRLPIADFRYNGRPPIAYRLLNERVPIIISPVANGQLAIGNWQLAMPYAH